MWMMRTRQPVECSLHALEIELVLLCMHAVLHEVLLETMWINSSKAEVEAEAEAEAEAS